MMRILKTASPYLLLAAGVLGATALSVATEEHGAWVLTGPVLLGASVLAAAVLARRLGVGRRASYVAAAITAGSFVLAGGIVLLRGAELVPELVPLLGTMGIVALGSPTCCARASHG